jgi:hypothetical protein
MKEQELIELDFIKFDETDENYYYYYRYIGDTGFVFISSESDKSLNKDEWSVRLLGLSKHIYDFEKLKTLLTLLEDLL